MSIYQSIYDLICEYIFGNLALTTTQTLVTELFSLGSCFLILSIPFIFVLACIILVIKFLWG